MEQKTCKKCGRILPKDYAHSKCESCRGKTIDALKNIGKGALKVGAAAGSVVVLVATKGKWRGPKA